MIRHFDNVRYLISYICIIFTCCIVTLPFITPVTLYAQENQQRVGTQDVIHIVQAGETLINIAFRYDVSLLRLALYNNIANVQNVRTGQILFIPDEIEFTPQVATTHKSLEKFANDYGWTIIQPSPTPIPPTPTPIPTPTFTSTPAPVSESQTNEEQTSENQAERMVIVQPDETPTPRSITEDESVWIPDVPQNAQALNLSCESRSAADLAGYYGIPINELEFFKRLPTSDNPHFGFVGDANDEPGSLPPNGYGVYAEPIASTLRKYGLCAEARYQLGIDGLKKQLSNGHPVIVWATYDMKIQPIYEYTAANRAIYEAVPYQHTFIAVGYDDYGIQLIDAYDGIVKYYTIDTFNAAWKLLNQMAVTNCIR